LYDFTGKPSFMMPAGPVRDWGDYGTALMAQDAIFLTTGTDEDLNNLGTFKGFTWGYPTLNVPSTWKWSNHQLNLTQGSLAIQFRFYEIKKPDGTVDYYVVTGQLSVKLDIPFKICWGTDWGVWCLGDLAAFWEVIPSDRYASLSDLQDDVTSRNKASNFAMQQKFYLYNSTTSEVLELYKDAGAVNTGGIAGMYLPNGTRLELKYYHVDTANRGRDMPLIEIFQLDNRGLFTGNRYVYSAGDGLIYIWNPWEPKNPYFCIDSVDYRYPRQGESCSGD
jgi:hypothetical protein